MNKTQMMVAATALAVVVVGIAMLSGYGVHRPGAAGDVPLVNTYWKLMSAQGEPVTLPEDIEREPHMVLQLEENRVAGFSGCNRFTGSYVLEAQNLTFPEGIAMTRMACPAGMTIEKAFAQVLERAAVWAIEDDTLVLSDEEDTPIATFEQRLMK